MKVMDQFVIVTGAASGLGAETARELSEAGAKVVLLDSNYDHVSAVASEINAFAFKCDVTDPVSCEKAIDKAIDKMGALSVLVNCAGISAARRLVNKQGPMPLEDFNKVLNVNLVGTFNMMRLCAQKMIQDKLQRAEDHERGVIINTSSIAAQEGQVGQVAYAASKGAVEAMTLPAARELGQFGIRVVTIAPGVMHTPMMNKMPEEVRDALNESVPFPKRLGDPAEYSSLVAQIIENSYLNGTTIHLDGALRMQSH